MSYSHADMLDDRRSWIAYMKLPTTQKATGALVDAEDPEARCCLGHACHVLEAPYEPVSRQYAGELNYPPQDIVDRLGLWDKMGGQAKHDPCKMDHLLSNGQQNLANWNDSAKEPVTQAEIAAYLETVIFGGDDTPFRELTEILFNCCTDNKAPDWSQYDALELNGCEDDPADPGTTNGGLLRADAQFFTVYGHLKEGGAEAITDVKDFDEALLVMQHLSKVSGIERQEVLC